MRRLAVHFTDRAGGVSEGPFCSLNVATSTGDDPRRVMANRRRASRAAGLGPGIPVWIASQVHGADVVRVPPAGEDDSAGAGRSAPFPWRSAGTGDVLVTGRGDQALAILVADCAPVLLANRELRAVAAAHAGWRGLAAGVLDAAVRALCDEAGYGCRPSDVEAWVGPSIRDCCYRIGDEVAAAVLRRVPRAQAAGVLRREADAGWSLDVAGTAREALLQAGVPEASIHVDARCTGCRPELFFSHRRDGSRTGRMAGIVALLEQRGQTRA